LREKNERLRRLSLHGAAEKIAYQPRSLGPADSITWACTIEDVRGGSGEESAARCRRFFFPSSVVKIFLWIFSFVITYVICFFAVVFLKKIQVGKLELQHEA
jgi:hypothetical protein